MLNAKMLMMRGNFEKWDREAEWTQRAYDRQSDVRQTGRYRGDSQHSFPCVRKCTQHTLHNSAGSLLLQCVRGCRVFKKEVANKWLNEITNVIKTDTCATTLLFV